ncbi:MAG TPA: HEAT repeat domain-containing protein [Bryobacteraceae bacterium]|jgi:HEAT repeat protein|nr:HEAT repeat domain-containing protein [Bryobacteraceae bacterium]
MRYLASLLLCSLTLAAQPVRPKDVRDVAKGGPAAIPKLATYLKGQDRDTRLEAAKQIADIGTARSLDPLVEATHDADSEIQIRATDGLVNFYLPGYLKTGLSGSLHRVGADLKGKFTDTNDQVIPPYMTVRPDVIEALGGLVRSGVSLDVRANAARAVGVLRGKAALNDLIDAAHTKDSQLLYESVAAIEKIRDESAGPRIEFLLRDPDSKVQSTAIEAEGVLQNKAALPKLIDALNHARDTRVKRAAMEAIAMLPDPSSRPLYAQYITDKDEKMRASAAEGFARLGDPAEMPVVQKAWDEETKTSPRLSLAFAEVALGKTEMSEFSPLRYLVNNLNSASYNGIARPFLVELARKEAVRQLLYTAIPTGTKEEKVGLAYVLGISGGPSSIPVLQKLSSDPDPEVAQAAMTAVRNLQAK